MGDTEYHASTHTPNWLFVKKFCPIYMAHPLTTANNELIGT